jgi:hypothetical protein
MLKIKQKKRRLGDTPELSFLSEETIHLPRIVAVPGEVETEYTPSLQGPAGAGDVPPLKSESKREGEPLEGVELQGPEGLASWSRLCESGQRALHSHPQVVKLSVGGVRFSTSLSTLTSRPGMLSAMFSGRYSPSRDEEGYYFIDRCVQLDCQATSQTNSMQRRNSLSIRLKLPPGWLCTSSRRLTNTPGADGRVPVRINGRKGDI